MVAAKQKSQKKAVEKKPKELERNFEEKMLKGGLRCVIGVDEAGRGPLAGPVVADDSKATTEEEREEMYEVLTHHSDVLWGVGIREPAEIDKMNILAAALACMTDAVNQVLEQFLKGESIEDDTKPVCGVLVDGNQIPPGLKEDSKFEVKTVVKGDATEFIIAAGSIIAKVHRDKLMRELDEKYPQYELAIHKGYPTPRHMQLVKQLGASEIHRRSFKPVLQCLPEEERRAMEEQLARQKAELQEKRKEKNKKESLKVQDKSGGDIRKLFGEMSSKKPKADSSTVSHDSDEEQDIQNNSKRNKRKSPDPLLDEDEQNENESKDTEAVDKKKVKKKKVEDEKETVTVKKEEKRKNGDNKIYECK